MATKDAVTCNYKFEWNHSHSEIIKNKGFTRELNKDVAEIFRRHMDKYVPWDSTNESKFHLATNVQVSANEYQGLIRYSMKYAYYQYVGDYKHDLSYHPKATSYWDKACWQNEKSEIMQEVNNARKRHARKIR